MPLLGPHSLDYLDFTSPSQVQILSFLKLSKFNDQKNKTNSKIENTKIQVEQNILFGLKSGLKVANLAKYLKHSRYSRNTWQIKEKPVGIDATNR